MDHAEYLRFSPDAKVTALERSNHFYYPPEDRERLMKAFDSFCRKNSD